MNCATVKGNKEIIEETLTHPCLIRIAGFINGEFLGFLAILFSFMTCLQF